jgi:hypothetical protein
MVGPVSVAHTSLFCHGVPIIFISAVLILFHLACVQCKLRCSKSVWIFMSFCVSELDWVSELGLLQFIWCNLDFFSNVLFIFTYDVITDIFKTAC